METSKIEVSLPDEYSVLGADLSLNRPGFCLIKMKKNKIHVERLDCVDNKSKPNKKPRGQTLTEIAEKLEELLRVEGDLFLVREKSINNAGFGKRSGTAARTGVSEVVGVTDYIAWKKQKQWDEIYPVSIKKLITGSGKADKEAVAAAVKKYLGELEFENDDESDAAAVAVAWLIKNNVIKENINAG